MALFDNPNTPKIPDSSTSHISLDDYKLYPPLKEEQRKVTITQANIKRVDALVNKGVFDSRDEAVNFYLTLLLTDVVTENANLTEMTELLINTLRSQANPSK